MAFPSLVAFSSKKVEKIFKLLLHHLEIVHRIVDEFSTAVESFLDKDLKKVEKSSKMVNANENSADEVVESIMKELMKGIIPHYDRSHILELITQAEKVASAAESGCRLLLASEDAEIPSELKELLKKHIKIMRKMNVSLSEMTLKLSDDLSVIPQMSKEVSKLESTADEIKTEEIRIFLKIGDSLNFKSRYVFIGVMDSVENICNRLEDISDSLRNFAVKYS